METDTKAKVSPNMGTLKTNLRYSGNWGHWNLQRKQTKKNKTKQNKHNGAREESPLTFSGHMAMSSDTVWVRGRKVRAVRSRGLWDKTHHRPLVSQ